MAMVCAFGLCASAQDKPKKEKAPKDKQETVDCCNKHKEHQCCDSSKVNGNSESHAHQNNGNHNGQNKEEHPKAGVKPGMK